LLPISTSQYNKLAGLYDNRILAGMLASGFKRIYQAVA
jgi:hypothetical protein